MIDESDEVLDRIIAGYLTGLYTQAELFASVLDCHTVDTIKRRVGLLPPPMAAEFRHWARETYDNELTVEDFGSIGTGRPLSADKLALIREWIVRL